MATRDLWAIDRSSQSRVNPDSVGGPKPTTSPAPARCAPCGEPPRLLSGAVTRYTSAARDGVQLTERDKDNSA